MESSNACCCLFQTALTYPFSLPPCAALLKPMGEQGRWQLAERFFKELEAQQLELMAREGLAAGAADEGASASSRP